MRAIAVSTAIRSPSEKEIAVRGSVTFIIASAIGCSELNKSSLIRSNSFIARYRETSLPKYLIEISASLPSFFSSSIALLICPASSVLPFCTIGAV